jgi:hypothetical protein
VLAPQSDILRGCDQAPAPADLPSDPGRNVPGLTYAPQANDYGTQPSPYGTPPRWNFERYRRD